MPNSFQTMVQSALLTVAFVDPVLAEPLVPKSLYFTTISVPADCTEIPQDEAGIWRCSLGRATETELNVQLDEILIPMEQISDRVWTNEDVVAVLTGPFFENWIKGATASTPENRTQWQIVAEEDLPLGMAACNDYRFDRHHAAAQIYIVEIGRFCVLTRHPVQWPYVLVGSVSLRNLQDRGAPVPDDTMARAQAILSTFQLSHP